MRGFSRGRAMGKVTGFLEFGREATPHRPVDERLGDWSEVQDALAARREHSRPHP